MPGPGLVDDDAATEEPLDFNADDDGVATNPDMHIQDQVRQLELDDLVDVAKDFCDGQPDVPKSPDSPRSELTCDVPTEPGAVLELGCPTDLISPRTEPPCDVIL